MDTHTPRNQDDLSATERRLSGWRPGAEGLDAAAMLFAAGLAAGRRGRARLLWPGLCVVLAGLVVGLGVWGLSERAERRALAGKLREPTPAPSAPQAISVAVVAESSSLPPPDGYFNLRRRAEQDLGRWLASVQPAEPQAVGSPPPQPAILRAGQRDSLLDH
jgi:hypothetical protein